VVSVVDGGADGSDDGVETVPFVEAVAVAVGVAVGAGSSSSKPVGLVEAVAFAEEDGVLEGACVPENTGVLDPDPSPPGPLLPPVGDGVGVTGTVSEGVSDAVSVGDDVVLTTAELITVVDDGSTADPVAETLPGLVVEEASGPGEPPVPLVPVPKSLSARFMS
jgi:hypothetical protein